MSRAHRKLTRTWRKRNAFKHGGRWYRWDAKMPKRNRYVTTTEVVMIRHV